MSTFCRTHLVWIALLLAACSRPDEAARYSEPSPASAQVAAPAVAEAGNPAEPALSAAAATPVAQKAAASAAAPVDAGQALASQVADGSQTHAGRQFVRTAELRFQVKDVYQSTLAIEDAVAAEGGFVVENRIDNPVLSTRHFPLGDGKRKEVTIYQTQGQLTVRLPSERMLPFLRVAAKQMAFLEGRSFRAEDVQFTLLRQQLEWQREQEIGAAIARAASGAGAVGDKVDAATARAQALRLRDEARVAQRQLEDQVAFGTLTLYLMQDARARSEVRLDPDAVMRAEGPGFWQRLATALGKGWQGCLDVLVVLAHLWPLWLVLLLGAVALRLMWRVWRRRFAPRAPER